MILILPGFSLHNKDWANEAAKYFGKKNVLIHNWLHWKSGKSSLSLKNEVINIKNEIEKINDKNINVLAKSVGTMVISHMLKNNLFEVDKLILCGIPSVSDERKKLFKEGLAKINNNKIIVFQNIKDPFVKYEEVKDFMFEVNKNIKVVKKERSDHNYPYFEEFKEFFN